MLSRRLRRYIRHGMLTQLAVFEAVVRHASFTRAGEALYMAQPTVSLHIKKLSDALELPLLEIAGRRPCPTAAGREVYAATLDIFRRLAELDARLAMLRSASSGDLRIAVSTTGKYFVPRLLAEFWRNHPDVRISLLVLNRQHLLDRLQADADDLYIFSNPPEGTDMVLHTLCANPMEIYAGADHPLAGRHSLKFADIANEPFLMREPGSGTRLVAETFYAQYGATPNVRMEFGSNEAIKQAIIAGMGISLLSRHTVGAGATKQLVALDVEHLPIRRYWYLAYPEDRQLPAIARAFVAEVMRTGTDSEHACAVHIP